MDSSDSESINSFEVVHVVDLYNMIRGSPHQSYDTEWDDELRSLGRTWSEEGDHEYDADAEDLFLPEIQPPEVLIVPPELDLPPWLEPEDFQMTLDNSDDADASLGWLLGDDHHLPPFDIDI